MSGTWKNPDVRWKQRFQSFRKAFGQLGNAVKKSEANDLSDLERQGLIQAFEFTYELAWKTFKDYLESEGEPSIAGPREAIRKTFAAGLIPDGEIWMEMVQSRNRSSHTYNEAIADEIASLVTHSYYPAFTEFERRFLQLEKSA